MPGTHPSLKTAIADIYRWLQLWFTVGRVAVGVRSGADVRDSESEPKITVNDKIKFFLKLQSAFWSFQTVTVSECCLIKFLPCILFEKYINILALEMASVGNRHCADCIGALSFPIAVLFRGEQVSLGQISGGRANVLHCCGASCAPASGVFLRAGESERQLDWCALPSPPHVCRCALAGQVRACVRCAVLPGCRQLDSGTSIRDYRRHLAASQSVGVAVLRATERVMRASSDSAVTAPTCSTSLAERRNSGGLADVTGSS